MKNYVTILISILVLGCGDLFGQAYHGVKSYPIYKQGARLVNALDEEEKEIVRIEYDLVFSSKTTFRTLTSEWEYAIVGFADEGVKTLDIRLYEYDDLLEEWSVVATGEPDGIYSVIGYQPVVTAQYMVEIVATEFHEGYSAARYGLVIFHD